MHKRLRSRGFEILAFPCSQFGNQEFAEPQKIVEFVKQFDVEFPLFAKVDVNGPNAHPVFRFLKYNSAQITSSKCRLGAIGWNFGKFLVDQEGKVVSYYGPKTKPSLIEPDLLKVLAGELKGTAKPPPSGNLKEDSPAAAASSSGSGEVASGDGNAAPCGAESGKEEKTTTSVVDSSSTASDSAVA